MLGLKLIPVSKRGTCRVMTYFRLYQYIIAKNIQWPMNHLWLMVFRLMTTKIWYCIHKIVYVSNDTRPVCELQFPRLFHRSLLCINGPWHSIRMAAFCLLRNRSWHCSCAWKRNHCIFHILFARFYWLLFRVCYGHIIFLMIFFFVFIFFRFSSLLLGK